MESNLQALRERNEQARMETQGKIWDALKETGRYSKRQIRARVAEVGEAREMFWQKKYEVAKKYKGQLQETIRNLREEIESIKVQLGIPAEEEKTGQENECDSNKSVLAQVKELESKRARYDSLRKERLAEVNTAIRELNEYNIILQGGSDIGAAQDEAKPFCFDVLEEKNERSGELTSAYVEKVRSYKAKSAEQIELRDDYIKQMVSEASCLLDQTGILPRTPEYPPAGYEADEELDDVILAGDPTAFAAKWENICLLQKRIHELQTVKDARETQLHNLAGKITGLWGIVGVPQEYTGKFFEDKKGKPYHLSTIRACEAEVMRLQTMHADKLKEALVSLWDEVGISEEERVAFVPAHQKIVSEETVDCLMGEIKRLEDLAETMRPILKMIASREEILEDLRNLEAEVKELGAKRFSIPRWMFKEEKIRKRAKKELPKIQKTLKKNLQEFEEATKKPFMYKGKRFIDVIKEYEAQVAATKTKSRTSTRRKKK